MRDLRDAPRSPVPVTVEVGALPAIGGFVSALAIAVLSGLIVHAVTSRKR